MRHDPLSHDGMEWSEVQRFIDETALPGYEAIDTGMTHETGLYFGMPEDEYHSIPALSASGIKRLLISNMDFWAESWLNPAYEEKESEAMALGSGYGVRILEGREAFSSRYAEAFDKTDYPDAVDTVADITAWLKDCGVTTGLSKLNKPQLIELLLVTDPSVQILDVLKAEHAKAHEGKEFLSAAKVREIEIAAYMIERDPEANLCFKGGFPEVTVIWIDPLTRVPMKARFDYLKIKAIVDLKSFSNPMGKSLDNAIGATMASRKYHLQAATYLEADRFASRFARAGRVFGDVDADWLKAYAEFNSAERSFIFVFQKTGIAPVTRVKEFSRVLETFKVAEASVRDAQHRFAQCWRHYGKDPWLDVRPLEQFGDEDFPLHIMEI
ncbi:MAG: PD-(D/E)XK nuclease-like domain-containing protein [Bdellovibrionales bacterium]